MVAQLAKGIKPAKLRVDKVRLNLLNALRAEGKVVKTELEKTTATWKGEKPTFKLLISLQGGNAVVLIGPGGSTKGAQKWVWLDEGTPRHPIVAKNPRISKRTKKPLPPMLVFRHGSGFTAKTKVGSFSSGSGSNTGNFVQKKKVIHPGIKARGWSVDIVKRRKKPFTNAMIKAARV